MAGKVYTNQELTLNFTFVDQDEAVIDISGGTVAANLFAPSNRTETETVGIVGSVVSGPAGTATADVPVDTLDEDGQWRVQPSVTLSGTEWPGEVYVILVTQRGRA